MRYRLPFAIAAVNWSQLPAPRQITLVPKSPHLARFVDAWASTHNLRGKIALTPLLGPRVPCPVLCWPSSGSLVFRIRSNSGNRVVYRVHLNHSRFIVLLLDPLNLVQDSTRSLDLKCPFRRLVSWNMLMDGDPAIDHSRFATVSPASKLKGSSRSAPTSQHFAFSPSGRKTGSPKRWPSLHNEIRLIATASSLEWFLIRMV